MGPITRGGEVLPYTASEIWFRPLGFVEGMYDTDGADFEGRADISTLFRAKVSTNMSAEALREKFLLAWAVLRFRHVLLSARALCRKDFLSGRNGSPTD